MEKKKEYCIARIDYFFNHPNIIHAINENININHDYKVLTDGEVISSIDTIFFNKIRDNENSINFNSELLNCMKNDEMPMICEISENHKFLTDVITGKSFVSHALGTLSLDYCFTIDYKDVLKLLKSLSDDEIKLYKKTINLLIKTASKEATKMAIRGLKEEFFNSNNKNIKKAKRK